MDFENIIPIFLGLAWLMPLSSFVLIVFFGRRMGRAGVGAGYLATAAICASFVLSIVALGVWVSNHSLIASHEVAAAIPLSGDWYSLGVFGSLQLTIGYYIDSLTLAMFCMVTLVSTCIHIYSFGYMHEELHEVTDSLATLSNGRPLKRRGRFFRFYQYLSLFCFSMLGLVIAGNLAMVFIFWELVGICSYLLIGFYIERKSASNAANKAFIVNRVGDFGMLIGLMVIWSGLGTFSFADYQDSQGQVRPGIFSQVRTHENAHALVVPDGMVKMGAKAEIEKIYAESTSEQAANAKVDRMVPTWREQGYGSWLLIIAGLGIFCGCVGKSAQFPLHVWLPDAMEGPTPVSALIHAATMVAAGVYLVGRFYPVFSPDVLLIIAYVGGITLFMAATIAIVATDIKRVLAYSTVSQLGYMTLALGVGGWVAGLFHLLTHAFFKSLLFLCSGSVIHACGTNEMTEMGALRKKMPWTAYTMLIGCLAISGAGIPLMFGLSGFHSKDSILAQAFSFKLENPLHGGLLFWTAALGTVITAFYMFRLWFMTFTGEPRDKSVYDSAHESPRSMTGPLVVLAFMATVAGWPLLPGTDWSLPTLLEQARPVGTIVGIANSSTHVPAEYLSHEHHVHVPVSLIASSAALLGFILAVVFYCTKTLNPQNVRRRFAPIYWFLRNKWWFDELYNGVFIQPVLFVSKLISGTDRNVIDWLVDGSAKCVHLAARLDNWIDRHIVDHAVDLLATVTYNTGIWLRTFQTGRLREYVMFLVIGTVTLFILVSLYWNLAIAG